MFQWFLSSTFESFSGHSLSLFAHLAEQNEINPSGSVEILWALVTHTASFSLREYWVYHWISHEHTPWFWKVDTIAPDSLCTIITLNFVTTPPVQIKCCWKQEVLILKSHYFSVRRVKGIRAKATSLKFSERGIVTLRYSTCTNT